MFQVNSDITVLDPKARKVHTIMSCINQPPVALRQGQSKPTFAYVCTMWTADESALEVFVLLFQPETEIADFYTHQDGSVPLEWVEDIEKDALDFTESMGFMMDNLNIGDVPLENQWQTIATLPPFMTDRSKHTGSTQDSAMEVEPQDEKTHAHQPLSDSEIHAAQAAEPSENLPASEPAAFDESSLMDISAEVQIVEEAGDEDPVILELEAEMERDEAPAAKVREEVSLNSFDFVDDTGAEINSLLSELEGSANQNDSSSDLDSSEFVAPPIQERDMPDTVTASIENLGLEAEMELPTPPAAATKPESTAQMPATKKGGSPAAVNDPEAWLSLLGSF
jgi:hypothetical protein